MIKPCLVLGAADGADCGEVFVCLSIDYESISRREASGRPSAPVGYVPLTVKSVL